MCYWMHGVCGSVFLVAGFVPKKGFPAPKVFSRSVCVCGCCFFFFVYSMWLCVYGWWTACTMNWNQSGGYRVVGYHVRQRHGEGALIEQYSNGPILRSNKDSNPRSSNDPILRPYTWNAGSQQRHLTTAENKAYSSLKLGKLLVYIPRFHHENRSSDIDDEALWLHYVHQ